MGGSTRGKESACHTRDSGSIAGSGRSPGVVNGNPLQHSYLERPMDRREPWVCKEWDTTEHKTTEGNNMETRTSVKELDHEVDVAENNFAF